MFCAPCTQNQVFWVVNILPYCILFFLPYLLTVVDVNWYKWYRLLLKYNIDVVQYVALYQNSFDLWSLKKINSQSFLSNLSDPPDGYWHDHQFWFSESRHSQLRFSVWTVFLSNSMGVCGASNCGQIVWPYRGLSYEIYHFYDMKFFWPRKPCKIANTIVTSTHRKLISGRVGRLGVFCCISCWSTQTYVTCTHSMCHVGCEIGQQVN